MSKPRKQTYALATYLNRIQERDISNDANVQRGFVWDNNQVSELVITVLTDDYITPIILCEDLNYQLRIVDGGQRSTALGLFRYFNRKISPSVEDPVIEYKKKIILDNGEVVWEDVKINVKNKTYDQLPDELKKKFDDFQIETVIHENCDKHTIARYIQRYNNHVAMNTNQKAFTYLDNFADIVRRITKTRFFIDFSDFTEKEKDKGILERAIVETVMCVNHLNDWKKQTKAICKYLNVNATATEFEKLEENLHRLESVITEDTKDIFNSKDAFIFLTLFDRFTEMGFRDFRFNEFLVNFKNVTRNEAHNENGKLFDEIDEKLGTKDKTVIMAKLDMLTKLLKEFLGVNESEQESILDFVRNNVSQDVENDDIELFESSFEDYTVGVDNNTVFLERGNLQSLIAITAYAYMVEKDIYMEEWLCDYFKRNSDYIKDQQRNYRHMKNDFDKFCQNKAA